MQALDLEVVVLTHISVETTKSASVRMVLSLSTKAYSQTSLTAKYSVTPTCKAMSAV